MITGTLTYEPSVCSIRVTRTKDEIKAKIKELVSDSENFGEEGYGYDYDTNEEYREDSYSEDKAEETLTNFIDWLQGEPCTKNS